MTTPTTASLLKYADLQMAAEAFLVEDEVTGMLLEARPEFDPEGSACQIELRSFSRAIENELLIPGPQRRSCTAREVAYMHLHGRCTAINKDQANHHFRLDVGCPTY